MKRDGEAIPAYGLRLSAYARASCERSAAGNSTPSKGRSSERRNRDLTSKKEAVLTRGGPPLNSATFVAPPMSELRVLPKVELCSAVGVGAMPKKLTPDGSLRARWQKLPKHRECYVFGRIATRHRVPAAREGPPPRIVRDFARRIPAARLAAGLTQEEGAAKSKVPYKYWQAVERGAFDVMLSTVDRFARALGLSPSEFLVPTRGRPPKRRVGRPKTGVVPEAPKAARVTSKKVATPRRTPGKASR